MYLTSHTLGFLNSDMYEAILFLEWGDTEIALASQQCVRVYIFSYIFGGISSSVWQLLEVTGHAAMGTIVSILWGASNVVIIGFLVRRKEDTTLADVALVYNGTSIFYIGFTILLAWFKGWLQPFWNGLVGTVSFRNWSTVLQMLKQAVPLAAGSFLSNAEWAVLTLLASSLGPAEVAAWALLGSIWDVFYSVTGGIGDAAEIRVAYHLGNGSGPGAKLSAYKSLFLGMVVACAVSFFYFCMQNHIPGWFTADETLQRMLQELVPFVGVANLTMTFGMQCWSLIGAQGNYKFATWVSFLSSWGLCMPLASVFVYVLRIDLQGLTSAVVLGYLSTGSALSYKLLSTDWKSKARKIQKQNAEAATGNESEETSEEMAFSALRGASSNRAAPRQVHLLTLPIGQRSGLVLGRPECSRDRNAIYIVMVRDESPLRGQVAVGDAVLSVNGRPAVDFDTINDISYALDCGVGSERYVSVMSSPGDVDSLFPFESACMCWDDESQPILNDTESFYSKSNDDPARSRKVENQKEYTSWPAVTTAGKGSAKFDPYGRLGDYLDMDNSSDFYADPRREPDSCPSDEVSVADRSNTNKIQVSNPTVASLLGARSDSVDQEDVCSKESDLSMMAAPFDLWEHNDSDCTVAMANSTTIPSCTQSTIRNTDALASVTAIDTRGNNPRRHGDYSSETIRSGGDTTPIGQFAPDNMVPQPDCNHAVHVEDSVYPANSSGESPTEQSVITNVGVFEDLTSSAHLDNEATISDNFPTSSNTQVSSEDSSAKPLREDSAN